MRGEKLGKLKSGMTRVMVNDGSLRITQLGRIPESKSRDTVPHIEYTIVKRFTGDDNVPLTDRSLTWKQVAKGTETARNAFHVFWYLYAITAERKYFELAEEIALSCPPEWPSFVLSQKNYSPIGVHRILKEQHKNPTGTDFWFDLLEIQLKFGIYEQQMIKQSGRVPGIRANLFKFEPPGDKRLLTNALIAASPYPHAVWITVRGRGDACKACIHSETDGEQSALPDFRTDYGGVQRIVVLPDDTVIRSLVDPPGPQAYG